MAKKSNSKKMIVSKEYVFVILVLFVLSLVMLTLSLTPKILFSLNCVQKDSTVQCQWSGCKISPDGSSELIIAEPPNYFQSVALSSSSGSTVFSPQPFGGEYTLILSCQNGNQVQRLTVS